MADKAALRRLLEKGETVVAPSAYDPLTARVIQHMGFNSVYVGGWMTGAHLTTTEPLTTLTEQVEVARKVVRAVNFPVICDGDAGFGDPVHTMRCVREFEAEGIQGIHIEDQVYPKRASYHRGLEHITPLDEFLEKMRYALQARKDRDFIIIGRTDAFRAVEGSREEAVRRARALTELGVDAILIIGVSERDDLAFFRKQVPHIPLMLTSGGNTLTVKDYQDLGYQIIIYPLVSIAAAAGAVYDIYQPMRAGGGLSPEALDKQRTTRQLIEKLIDLPEYYQVEDATTERKRGP
ncbi:MAG: isocitrate lyase/PEP mutase family protein [Chloroflexi bacterium]|nr:isocitrate lyase/PEP mutase family protein [Chloroflexota bacterium]